jgi:hypothetical protein
MELLKRSGLKMIETINDKCVVFNQPFTSEDGLYHWSEGVKYGLIGKDDNFYYIYRTNLPPYRLSKDKEFDVYNLITPQDKQYENKR